ncbi:DNA-binding transcriptional regulator, PadR family [Nocardiopsis flavescens]|uniref:DNA-binding transcriptional regulator, PadR family n=1 Tax=Nocardiopsis flavescens TaxID=758803 RepID=A0A1M6I7F1_9ACTN|nr:helix-turn-helix transcriptional regulator [Nocardiopsis flavescens]SHJ30370.1 DNA-binding transcriptional regulator, PadR family [Nocardiopsis flavescens]
MSTFFGHGRLRLYLLKLLDESPRHGYEIISLLRDRFLGVYSPSPGTIYPRLARLEEEGLVTHTEEGGRKVYSLTDKGRAELRARENDLDDLEREITDSVRDIARAVKQDVRETISSLREELKFAAGGARRPAEEPAARQAPAGEAPRREEPAAKEEPAAEKEPGTGTADGGGSREQDRPRDGEQAAGDRACDDGHRWSREWERFTQGFGAFGAVWGRGGSGRTPDLDQALRDFSERVRDVAREAGTVGEAAVHDLRRILDDTVEVIRRDARGWGPPAGQGAEPGTDGSATAEPQAPGTGEPGTAAAGEAPAAGTGGPEPAADAQAPKPGADGPEPAADAGPGPAAAGEAPGAGTPDAGDTPAAEPEGSDRPGAARPAPPSDDDGGGDPWSRVVDDPGTDR